MNIRNVYFVAMMVAMMVVGTVLTFKLAFPHRNDLPDLYVSAFIVTTLSIPSIMLLITFMSSRRVREALFVSPGSHGRKFVCLHIVVVLLPVCAWTTALLLPQHHMHVTIGSIFVCVYFAALGSISKLLGNAR